MTNCQLVCGTGIPPTYNCEKDVCVDPLDGTGTYTSLIDCLNNCGSGSGSGSGRNNSGNKTLTKNPKIF